ncbi:hypothetical protein B0J11DRAFT_580213 [Dendryphion nanum]|uniref:GPI anchored serine-threonine rich protein n=1 Tax=Dendryphion nanum TaxID=256645 RepID=A0A9P9DUU6_9PLEO|nr:hypothetical protein B0J11DRAFT_580213 [Dendryphion nanum]
MRTSFLALALSALTFVSAQTPTLPSTSQSTACPAQNIVDACLSGYQDRIKACEATSNDWVCLCDVYTDVLQCYINCPDSSAKSPVQNQVTSFCNAAAPAKSAISASLAAAASTRPPVSSTSSASGTASSPTGTGAPAAASTTASRGAADATMVPVTGVMAVLLGLAGLL